MGTPKITVYIPSRNYGHFLEEAIESVLAQTRQDWELIVVDEDSTDGTEEIAGRYCQSAPERIRLIRNSPARGLQGVANQVLGEARGQYIVRLDADDYLDEHALQILAGYLDEHTDVALVYPNYIYVDERGDVLGVERRKKLQEEVEVLDLPAHGAGTMVRKRVLKSVGGYDESNDRQDGYDLWLKVAQRYKVANVTTPLFYYRQHSESLTRDEDRLLEVRMRLQRKQVALNGSDERLSVLAVVTAKNTYRDMPNVALSELAGRPLIDHTLECVAGLNSGIHVLVSTDDSTVVDHVRERWDIPARMRPTELSSEHARLGRILTDAVEHVESTENLAADVVVALSIHSPLRRSEHVQAALDTLLLYDVDSVIAVYEDRGLHFVHGRHGLETLNPAMHRQIRTEREALYVDNGAIHALWREILTDADVLGRRVGHVVMPYWDSVQVKSPRDAWLVEQILKDRRESAGLPSNSYAARGL